MRARRTGLARFAGFIGAPVGVGLLAAASVAAAVPPPPDAAPERLERLEAEIDAQRKLQEAYEAEARARADEARALRRQIAAAGRALVDMEAQAAELEARLADLAADEAAIRGRLAGEREALVDVLAALQLISRNRPPAIAVTPDDATTAARAAMLLADAAPALGRRAAALEADLDRLAALETEIAAERTALAGAESEIRRRSATLQSLLLRARQERDAAQGLMAAAQRAIADLAQEAQGLRALVAELERLARRAAPRLKPELAPARPTPAGPAGFALARGRLAPPVAGRIAIGFGQRLANDQRSEGLLFLSRPGATVVSPADGRVIFARAKKPIGNVLILDAGDGYHLVMTGFDRFLAEEGQLILAGEPLGALPEADAGGAAPELYLELRRRRAPIDPAPWFDMRRGAGGN